jgi:site-specific recombinase XerD
MDAFSVCEFSEANLPKLLGFWTFIKTKERFMARDSLKWGIGRANLSGSGKTQRNNRVQASCFVDTLRECGFGVQKWTNLTNAHVQAVVNAWLEEGKKTGTIKTYLSSVREVARAFGNDRLSVRNSDFGIARRVYADNIDKSVPQDAFDQAIHKLRAHGEPLRTWAATLIELQREFGLRKEESMKLDLKNDFDETSRTLWVRYGTKGGLPRLLENLSDKQVVLLRQAMTYSSHDPVKRGKTNLLPHGLTESQAEDRLYYRARWAGLSKRACGASLHGNRHARGQEIYKAKTGFDSPCKFNGDNNAWRKAAERAIVSEISEGSQGHIIKREITDEVNRRHEEGLSAINKPFGHGGGRRIGTAYLGKK